MAPGDTGIDKAIRLPTTAYQAANGGKASTDIVTMLRHSTILLCIIQPEMKSSLDTDIKRQTFNAAFSGQATALVFKNVEGNR